MDAAADICTPCRPHHPHRLAVPGLTVAIAESKLLHSYD